MEAPPRIIAPMPTSDRFSVGLVQHRCDEDRDTNLRRAAEGVREAASKGAQIVCLQEMFNTPYFCKSEDFDRFDLAEPILPPETGPSVLAMQDAAKKHKVVVVAPIFERRAPGLYHNSAAIIDADGSLLGVYRKMHIPDDPLYYEKFYFTPGDAHAKGDELPLGPGVDPARVNDSHGFRVWRTRYANIGVLICWDQWYPEGARINALLGADLLLYPTAIGWRPEEKEEFGEDHRDAWRLMQRAHAASNELFVAAVNRTGHEPEPGTGGVDYFGSSFVADPFGKVIAEAPVEEESVLVCDCDRTLIDRTRRHWPFLRDRRVDAYHGLTRRWLGA